MTTQNSNVNQNQPAAGEEKFGRARWVKEMGVSPFYRLEEMLADFEGELDAVYTTTGVKQNTTIENALSDLRVELLNEMESTLDDWRAGKLTPEHQAAQQAADEGYESDDVEVEVEEVEEAAEMSQDIEDAEWEDEAEETPVEPQACVCEHLQAKPGEGASPLIELVFQLGLFIERVKLVYRACGFEEGASNEMPVMGLMEKAYAEILRDSKLIEDDWRAGRLPSIDEASFGLPGDSNSPRETLACIDLASFKIKRLVEEVKGLCSPFAFASNAGSEPCGKAFMALKSARKNLRKLHESIIADVAESAGVGGVIRAGV